MERPDKYLVLNQSRITSYMMCPRFYELRHLDRLSETSKALRIGTLTHRLLEKFNKAKALGKTYEPVKSEDTDQGEWDTAEKLYWAYYREYGSENITLVQPEVEACCQFGKITTPSATWYIWLISKLDGIIQDKGLYLEEYKTCANLGAAQFEKFLNDFQITCYMWMAQKDLQIHLNGARITLLPKTKNPLPQRMRVTRSAHQFQEWEKTVLFECRSMIMCMEQGYFPQRHINCTKWNRACMFHDYCITGERVNLADLPVEPADYAEEKRRELTRLGKE